MKRYLLILLLLPLSLFGCALCTLYTPTAHAALSFKTKGDRFEKVTFTWTFSENFSKQLYDSYDHDGDQMFNTDELKEIKQTLLDYIEPKRYLTQFSYYDQPEGKNQTLPLKVVSHHLHVKDNALIFSYTAPLTIPIKEGRVFIVRIQDKEEYFNFKLTNEPIQLTDILWVLPNINNQVGYYEINENTNTQLDTKHPLTTLIAPSKKDQKSTVALPTQSTYTRLGTWLSSLTGTIKTLLKESAKEGVSFALLNLLIVSFLYGVLHAAGPGHGKTLVGSYFAGAGGTWTRALWMALRIGIIHVTGAVLLVAVTKYGLEMFIGKVLNDTALYTTKIASLVILSITAWLFWQKFKKPSHHQHHCGCHHCTPSHKSDWGIALAAGMIPCPGTVVIFILAFTFGTYISGFLSAVAMALGMSTIIFFSSLLGQHIHHASEQFLGYFMTVIEYLSLIILAILGIVMFISAESIAL